MYQKILVPIDINHAASAESSIKVANTLLNKGGDITLLYVLEDLPGYIELQLPRETQLRNMDEAKVKLEELAKANGSDAKCTVIVGHASRSILDHANKHSMDCIIVASHKPGFEDYLIGSNAARIVRHSKCAVHVLR